MILQRPSIHAQAALLGRFRRAIGEASIEELLTATINTAVTFKALSVKQFEGETVDTTVQQKVIVHLVDSHLLEMARVQLVRLAMRAGIVLKRTHGRDGRMLRRKSRDYANAKQFKRPRRTPTRQLTTLGIVVRDLQCKLENMDTASSARLQQVTTTPACAERIRLQQFKGKNKLYAPHALEVDCIGKGKARQAYKFGLKACVVVTKKWLGDLDAHGLRQSVRRPWSKRAK